MTSAAKHSQRRRSRCLKKTKKSIEEKLFNCPILLEKTEQSQQNKTKRNENWQQQKTFSEVWVFGATDINWFFSSCCCLILSRLHFLVRNTVAVASLSLSLSLSLLSNTLSRTLFILGLKTYTRTCSSLTHTRSQATKYYQAGSESDNGREGAVAEFPLSKLVR